MSSFIKVDSVRCVLPGVPLPLGKNGDYLVAYFKDKHDIKIEYLTQAKTLPIAGEKGSRIDQIFNVPNYHLDKFAKIKESIGALYATEIVKKNEQHLYTERIYLKHFQRPENDLLKSGEISKDHVYQITK